MSKKFNKICMIIHAGRVGSTVVASSLTALPVIVAGEIFNPLVNNIPDWPAKFNYLELYNFMLGEAHKFGSPYANYQPTHLDSCAIYLFEYKPYHLGCGENISQAVTKFSDNGVTDFVFMHRENYLRRYVSYLIALSSGTWHTSATRTAPYMINVDTEHCSDYEIGIERGTLVQLIDHYYKYFVPSITNSIKGKRNLVLTYEAHIEKNPSIACEMIQDFLGIDGVYEQKDMGYRKQNNFSLQDIIINYDQVAKVVTNHGYGYLLD